MSAAIDFACRTCGAQCPIAGPDGAVCPAHCDDHDFQHQGADGRRCVHCFEPAPDDWFDDVDEAVLAEYDVIEQMITDGELCPHDGRECEFIEGREYYGADADGNRGEWRTYVACRKCGGAPEYVPLREDYDRERRISETGAFGRVPCNPPAGSLE